MKRFFIGFLIVFLAGCTGNKTPIGSNFENFTFPLKVGNKWEYVREISIFNIRPDTLDPSIISDTTMYDTTRAEIVREQIILDSISTFVFSEELIEDNQIYRADSYFNNRADGLYFYAYYGPGFVLPKRANRGKFVFKGRTFNSVKEIIALVEKALPQRPSVLVDSLIYEIPPLQSIKYPVRFGSRWVYRRPGHPWAIDKKVVGAEKITVPAGKFSCVKIQWLHDMDDNGEWENDIIFYDYISSHGLVKRSILFKDVIVVPPSGPDPVGYVDVKYDYILKKLRVSF